MANQKALTAANIRYLLTMKALDREDKGVRCVDIASSMGLSKPSVHNMMHTLIQLGLVKKDSYGAAFLTEAGHRIALCYSRYYRSVSGLLRSSFPELTDVQGAACSPKFPRKVWRRSAADANFIRRRKLHNGNC